MHYETINTQAKIAELLHASCTARGVAGNHDLGDCPIRAGWVPASAAFLGKLMPTIVEEIVPQVREDERAKVIAERDEARSRLTELENAINWDTTCLACSQTLDAAYMQTVRAETAEAGLAVARREAEQAQAALGRAVDLMLQARYYGNLPASLRERIDAFTVEKADATSDAAPKADEPWRDFTIHTDWGNEQDVYVACRLDDVCEEVKHNPDGGLLTLGEAVDWAKEYAASPFHAAPDPADTCRKEHPASKQARERNPGWHTRIVDCDLPAGHEGDHEETDTGNTWPQAAGAGDGEQDATCGTCGGGIWYQDCPAGGWWIHDQHPVDGHDAEPFPADDGEPFPDQTEDYEPRCGNPECAGYHCGSCGDHTGQMGHYAAFCQVTRQRAPHHFCCPDDCELHPAAPAVAAPDADSGESYRSCGCLTNGEGAHRGDCPEWETLEDRNGRYWLRRVAADGGVGS